MAKAIVETQPPNKASSEIREMCNPGILAGIPGRDGHLTTASQLQPQTPGSKGQGPLPSQGQGSGNGFTSCSGDTALGKTLLILWFRLQREEERLNAIT